MHTAHKSGIGVALCAAALFTAGVSAATVSLSLSPVGPIHVNDEFDVDILLSGWDPGDGEVDGITLLVDFDGSLFSYVSGSGDSGGFLSEGQQASYAVTDVSGEAVGNRFLLSFYDNSFAVDNTVGSVGGADNAGRLGQFRLRADAVGTGSLTPLADAGDDDFVFFDQSLFSVPASSPITWSGASMTVVVPEPTVTAFGMLAAAVGAVVLVRRSKNRSRSASS